MYRIATGRRSWLLCALWLFSVAPIAGGSSGSPPRVIRSFAMGHAGGARIGAQVFISHVGPGDFGHFTVRFTARGPDGRVWQWQEEAGVGSLAEARIAAADVVGLGRRQLFISVHMGGVATHLYDCDGKRLRSLYEGPPGRVYVRLRRDRRRWTLVESWGAAWDEENLGLVYDNGAGGLDRTLHWNGRRFVPDHPGPTRIRRGRAGPP